MVAVILLFILAFALWYGSLWLDIVLLCSVYVGFFVMYKYLQHSWNVKVATKEYKQSKRSIPLFSDKSYWKKDMNKRIHDG